MFPAQGRRLTGLDFCQRLFGRPRLDAPLNQPSALSALSASEVLPPEHYGAGYRNRGVGSDQYTDRQGERKSPQDLPAKEQNRQHRDESETRRYYRSGQRLVDRIVRDLHEAVPAPEP